MLVLGYLVKKDIKLQVALTMQLASLGSFAHFYSNTEDGTALDSAYL